MSDLGISSEMKLNEKNNNDNILECQGIVKCFPGNIVLKKVDFTVKRGEVHALVGSNGAGKSTLVKIITGVYTHDEGSIFVDKKEIKLANPSDAEAQGIAIIHQDQQLVPQFDVTRNAFLGREITGAFGLLDFKAMRKATENALNLIEADFGPDTLISNLSVGQREQVAIAAALINQPKILILDEPTASLSNKEIKRLFEIINLLKSQGVTIIYISHHFDEIFEISDRITVLRDGQNSGSYDIEDSSREQIIRLMTGRDISKLYPKEDITIGDVILELKDLKQGHVVNGVNLIARKGEILGIAGLVGAGRTEMALTIYGAAKQTGGQILINGHEYKPSSANEAKNLGIALIPEDRRNEGLVNNLSIKENMSLAHTSKWSTFGFMKNKLEKIEASKIVETLNIKTTGINQLVKNLSGGNQQKVVIGRWLTGNSQIFIFDQPTTGVDVSAKVEIYKQMSNLARQGATILFISSEFEELLGMSDRILVMAKGKVVKEFKHGEATENDLLYWATGAA